MTREQANEYNNELKVQLQNCAKEMHMDQQIGEYIIDHFIEFIPEEYVMNMILGTERPFSFKPGNVRIDLKKAIGEGLDLMASINAPKSIFNYIQLLILSARFIGKIFIEELSNLEAQIVYWLHERGAYQTGIEEEQFMLHFQEWYQTEEGKTLELKELIDAINHLYQIKVTDFKNGNIYLKEKVWRELP